jgi:hypothetical protein
MHFINPKKRRKIMSYTKTTWKDHETSKPNTYSMTENADHTVTLTPAGDVLQQGTPMNAANLNHMEQGIADAHSATAQLDTDKVDKVSGKELSTNDFDDDYKAKLDNVDTEVTEDSENLITSGAVFAALAGASGEDINALKNMVFPHIGINGVSGMAYTLTKGTKEITGTVGQTGKADVIVPELGAWQFAYTLNSDSFTKNISVDAPMSINDVNDLYSVITVTAASNATVTASKSGSTSIAVTADNDGIAVINVGSTGTWTISATISGESKSKTCNVESLGNSYFTDLTANIYGVAWDGSSSTAWTRTDDSASFSDPVPYVSGATSYSSPFDNLSPWKDMTVSSRTGGEMVSIPKFWYKIEQTSNNGIKIQISDKAADGFSVSPAHMDRGDGKGERNTVYIGRYHCASDYTSKTGVKPVASITRSTARSSIHNLGSDIWQCDFAMRFTIWLLYIVEYADWNSQAKIGKGCGDSSATGNMGYSDSMPYHTGTTQSSRDSYGLGTQYRNIEGLWDNVRDWTDGCYYDGNGMNIILNPSDYSDSSGGTTIGIPSSGYPSKFEVKTINGAYPMFIPTEANGSESTYSCDNWYYGSSSPCLNMGGSYNQNGDYGMLFVSSNSASNTNAYIGSRLQELP